MSGEPDFLAEVEMQLGSDWKSPMDKRNEEIENSLSEDVKELASLFTNWSPSNASSEYIDPHTRIVTDEELTKLMDFMKKYATELNIHRFEIPSNIKQFPKDLIGIDTITTLRWNKAQLTELPDELCNMTQLTSLYVSRNHLTTLPPSITKLVNLQKLDVSYNGKTEDPTNEYSRRIEPFILPPYADQLKQLEDLEISNCGLTKLPASLKRLPKLENLDIGYNPLKVIPKEVFNIKTLKDLHVVWAEIRTIPPEIKKLQKLEWLSLDRNNIMYLPPELFELSQLDHLSLSGNQIMEIPSEIGQLTKLTNLSINDNKLHTLPPEIVQLKLTSFSVWNNNFTRLPPEIMMWEQDCTIEKLDFNQPLNRAKFIFNTLKKDPNAQEYELMEEQGEKMAQYAAKLDILPETIEYAKDAGLSFYFGNSLVEETLAKKWYGDGYDYVRVKATGRRSAKGNAIHCFEMCAASLGHLMDKREITPCCRFCCHFSSFIIWVALLSSLLMSTLSTDQTFYFVNSLKGKIVEEEFPMIPGVNEFSKTFNDISNAGDFWVWVNGPLADAVWSEDGSYVNDYDLVIGPVIFRQLRVAKEECVDSKFSDIVGDEKGCYPVYSESNEYTQPFATNNATYDYTPPAHGNAEWSSPMGITYPLDGGYVITMSSNRTEALATIEQLQDENSGWIDDATRAIFVEFTVYNPNIDQLCMVEIMIERSPAGAYVPFSTFTAFKLTPFTISGTLIVLFLILLGYIVTELGQIITTMREGFKFFWKEYFSDYWNIAEIALYVLSIAAIATHGVSLSYVNDINIDLTNNTLKPDCEDCATFKTIANMRVHETNILAALFVLSWLLLSKFLRIYEFFGVFFLVFVKMFADIFRFLFMYIIFAVSFAGGMTIIFAGEVFEFRTWGWSIIYLFRITLGDFDWERASAFTNKWAFFLLFLYVILSFIMLLNLLIAMLNQSYSKVVDFAKNEYVLEFARLISSYSSAAAFKKKKKKVATELDSVKVKDEEENDEGKKEEDDDDEEDKGKKEEEQATLTLDEEDPLLKSDAPEEDTKVSEKESAELIKQLMKQMEEHSKMLKAIHSKLQQ